MKITKLYDEAGSGTSGLSDNHTISIDDATEINGRTGYRRVVYLRFQFDGYANAIRINTQSSKLTSQFEPYLYHLSESDETFQTQDWEVLEEHSLVKVHLTHPWRLNKVKTWEARGLDVLRLAGEALSDEPTIKANANTTIAPDFISQDFALRIKAVYSASQVTPAANASGSASGKAAAKGKGKSKASEGKTVMKMMLAPEAGPGVSLDDIAMEESLLEDLAAQPIPAHGIQWIQLKSYPTGPRLCIGQINQEPNDQTQWQTLWTEPGQHLATIAQSQATAANLLRQLQTQLDRFFEQAKKAGTPVSSDLFIPLAIESDMPAKFRFNDLEIEYSLLKNQWDHWTEEQKKAGKQTLQFDGTGLYSFPLQLHFPAGAQVNKALIHLGTDISETSGFAAGALGANLQQTTGLQANPGTTLAKCLDLSQAKQVNQAAIAILPVTENASIKLQLAEDLNGKPLGAILSETSVDIAEPGRQWIVTSLSNSVLLDSKNYWLTLLCSEGTVIWLGDATSGKAYVIKNGSHQLINSVTLLGELGHSLPAAQASTPGNLALQCDAAVQAINGDAVDVSSYLASPPAAIQLLSGEAGAIVLYAPEIEYS